MSSSWFVIQVVSGQEKKVKRAIEENLSSHGMEGIVQQVLVPTENVAEVKGGEQHITEKRLWPGYILVNFIMSDDAWQYIRNTNGVLGFLGGGKPLPLSDQEVREILEDLQHKKEDVVQKHNLSVGDHVKITDGVFVNFVGEVVEVFYEKGRASVLVSIFGRETRVDDLEFWQIEQVPVERK